MKKTTFVTVALAGLSCLPLALRASQTPPEAPPSRPAQPHGDLKIDCGECHSAERWSPVEHARFDHSQTGFRLEGAHRQTPCRSCHESLEFSHVATACSDCHKDVHRGELGPLCETCHNPSSWSNQREMFQVHNRTRFPLLAAHASLDCQACHKGQRQGEYALTPTDCFGCHADTYARTSSPNHAQAGFSTRCEQCHGLAARGWQSIVGFAHPASFPLTGQHAGLPCSSCHTGGFGSASRECVACHEPDYQRAANPNHVTGKFPRQCDQCHSGTSWRPARFDHGATRFQLTGGHANVACERCHPGQRYAGTSLECVSCHQANYSQTTNPNHAAGRFPTTCQSCHTTTAWRPASFNHDNTRFRLTGAHASVACERCHPGGRYSGTSTLCYSCHQSNYQQASNPSHSGFPTTCESCHGTNAWRPASFNHEGYFPIYSGEHRGKWSSCADCHVNSGNYRVFECINCHEHNRGDTDREHRGVGGYQYNSSSCYRCHPRGSED